jgi:hypothetical protein
MNDLHSLAYTNSLSYGSSLGWDYHNLGLLNSDNMSLSTILFFLFIYLIKYTILNVVVYSFANVMINVDIELYDMVVMDASAASFSTQESDFSTGYLEDALVEFGESSKRRRLLTDDEQSKNTISIDDFDKVYIVEYVFFSFHFKFEILVVLGNETD